MRLLFILLSTFSLFQAQAKDATTEFNQVLDNIQETQKKHWPQTAAYYGDESKAGELNDVSAQHYRKVRADLALLKQALSAVNPDKLSFQEQISRQMQLDNLQQQIADIDFKEYQIPINSESSFHVGLATMHRYLSFKNQQDYDNYISRLKQVPRVVDQHIRNLSDGLKRGFTQPKIILEHYPEFIDAYIEDDVSQSGFYQPFLQKPTQLTDQQFKNYQLHAQKLIKEHVNPSYQRFKDFMVNTYLPQTRTEIGAYQLPDGKSYYQQQIKEYTTLDLTPQEIHDIGLKEVKRIRAEMEAIIESLIEQGEFTPKTDDRFAEFIQFLRTDTRFYPKTAEELLKEASYIAKQMDGQLPKLFNKLPRQPYTVKPVPAAFAPNYTTGRYSGAPIDSTRSGEYWVNTYALDKRPLYNLEALTFHEAVPGHHLQNALTQELDNLPEFRRRGYISAFGEGWGLYCEKLAKEVGFYKDPYSDFGRLTYEMWRAMRLVVDTGMHAMGMSREEAINLMADNTALSKHNVRTEIDRYIGWPAQALSYKLGEIKIWELRHKAEQALGSDFDLRDFHDTVLSGGAVPLDVLEQMIDRYIKQSQESSI
ncbi:DUF885 domain-containing protein [Marinicella gelatinilytica]|uniref:DUF885 domain-containing protein n=1 Tax=Marinicella gelatinilytica TaxID=2996017 RepID=UPI0022608592|nr:DUF885 domain-containing protein [Marinicella gelatinilytica]MCX7544014.1 DUF885 domain-containing protein [Marinicella gelatinilytica]